MEKKNGFGHLVDDKGKYIYDADCGICNSDLLLMLGFDSIVCKERTGVPWPVPMARRSNQ